LGLGDASEHEGPARVEHENIAGSNGCIAPVLMYRDVADILPAQKDIVVSRSFQALPCARCRAGITGKGR
jgi:hypothetical protein